MSTAPVNTLWSYELLRSKLQLHDDAHYWAQYRELQLTSHFQPIVSLTHARVIGHEGLIRSLDLSSQAVDPYRFLHPAEGDPAELLRLDRLCRLLHMANAVNAGKGWLFLNMHPRVFASKRSSDQRGFTVEACREFGIARENIVVELLEHSLLDEDEFADTVSNFHEQGYLVALDDFGAGHSNFDRVWRISPEIVKLDRVFAVGAESEMRIRRLLPRIVALLHEAGVFVVLEGIETRTQAMIALDANIDFAQGDYFGRPQAAPLAIHSVVNAAAELWQGYESEIVEQRRRNESRLQDYKAAIQQAAGKIEAGDTFADACIAFLALPDAEFCYLLDGDGRQISENLWRPGYETDRAGARFLPISNIGGARWSRRPYFRNALDHVGQPQASIPYLSSASAHVCITVSMAFRHNGEMRVICGDVVRD